MTSVIVDTGPLVALLDRREHHHVCASKVMDTIEPPLFIGDAVLSEVCFCSKARTVDPMLSWNSSQEES